MKRQNNESKFKFSCFFFSLYIFVINRCYIRLKFYFYKIDNIIDKFFNIRLSINILVYYDIF